MDPVEITGGNMHEVEDLARGCTEWEQKLVALRSSAFLAFMGATFTIAPLLPKGCHVCARRSLGKGEEMT